MLNKSIAMIVLFGLTGVVLAACQPTNDPNDQQNNPTEAMEVVENSPATTENDSDADSEMMDASEIYTLEMIAQHNSADDCWMAIDGQVYDVTPFIASQTHPGGAAILEGCGTDATQIFNERPKDGEPHSDQARSFLPNYLIGTLAAN